MDKKLGSKTRQSKTGSEPLNPLTLSPRVRTSLGLSPRSSRGSYGEPQSILGDNSEIDEPKNPRWFEFLGEDPAPKFKPSQDLNIVQSESGDENLFPSLVKRRSDNLPLLSSDSDSIPSIVVPRKILFSSQLPPSQEPFVKVSVPFLIETRKSKRQRPDALEIPPNTLEASAEVPAKELFRKKKSTASIFPKDYVLSSEDDTQSTDTRPANKLFGQTDQAVKSKFPSRQSMFIRKSTLATDSMNLSDNEEWKQLPSSTLVGHQITRHESQDLDEDDQSEEESISQRVKHNTRSSVSNKSLDFSRPITSASRQSKDASKSSSFKSPGSKKSLNVSGSKTKNDLVSRVNKSVTKEDSVSGRDKSTTRLSATKKRSAVNSPEIPVINSKKSQGSRSTTKSPPKKKSLSVSSPKMKDDSVSRSYKRTTRSSVRNESLDISNPKTPVTDLNKSHRSRSVTKSSQKKTNLSSTITKDDSVRSSARHEVLDISNPKTSAIEQSKNASAPGRDKSTTRSSVKKKVDSSTSKKSVTDQSQEDLSKSRTKSLTKKNKSLQIRSPNISGIDLFEDESVGDTSVRSRRSSKRRSASRVSGSPNRSRSDKSFEAESVKSRGSSKRRSASRVSNSPKRLRSEKSSEDVSPTKSTPTGRSRASRSVEKSSRYHSTSEPENLTASRKSAASSALSPSPQSMASTEILHDSSAQSDSDNASDLEEIEKISDSQPSVLLTRLVFKSPSQLSIMKSPASDAKRPTRHSTPSPAKSAKSRVSFDKKAILGALTKEVVEELSVDAMRKKGSMINFSKSPTRRQVLFDSDSEDDRILLIPRQVSQEMPLNSPPRASKSQRISAKSILPSTSKSLPRSSTKSPSKSPEKSPSKSPEKSPPKPSTSAAKSGAQTKQGNMDIYLANMRDKSYAQRKESTSPLSPLQRSQGMKSQSRILDKSKSPSTSAAKPEAQKKQGHMDKYLASMRNKSYAQRHELQASGSQMRNAPSLLTRKLAPQLKPAVPKSGGKDLNANDAAVNVAASYKPPKLYQPKNWVTVRLYNFLETKMQAKYHLDARLRSEQIIKKLIKTYSEVCKKKTSPPEKWKLVRALMRVLAEHDVVKTNMDFYYFCGDYLPYEYRCVFIPLQDNNLPAPAGGLLGKILPENTTQNRSSFNRPR